MALGRESKSVANSSSAPDPGEHSCWFPGSESRSFSSSAQGQPLLNLQVKCQLLRGALPDPSKVAQRSKAQLNGQSAELGRSLTLDNIVKSPASMLLPHEMIKCLYGSSHSESYILLAVETIQADTCFATCFSQLRLP